MLWRLVALFFLSLTYFTLTSPSIILALSGRCSKALYTLNFKVMTLEELVIAVPAFGIWLACRCLYGWWIGIFLWWAIHAVDYYRYRSAMLTISLVCLYHSIAIPLLPIVLGVEMNVTTLLVVWLGHVAFHYLHNISVAYLCCRKRNIYHTRTTTHGEAR